MQVWWRTHLSFWHHVNGRYDAVGRGDRRSARDRRALRARRLPVRDRPRGGLGAHQQGRLRRRERTLLEAMERRLSPSRRMDWAYFHHLRANLEQRLGHFGNAAKDAERGGRARPRNRACPRCRCRTSSRASRTAASRRATAKAACARWTRRSRRASEVDRKTFEQQRELVLDRRRHRRRRNASARPSGLAAVLADYRDARAGRVPAQPPRPRRAARQLRARARHRDRVRAHADRAQRARRARRRGAGVAVPVAHSGARRIRARRATASRCASPARRSSARSIC